jgi:TP901 family phage tail tape measure protein
MQMSCIGFFVCPFKDNCSFDLCSFFQIINFNKMSEVSSRINVYINGREAAKSLKDLQADSIRLTQELSGMTAGTDAFVKKSKELAKVEASVAKMTKAYEALVKEAGGGLDTVIEKQKKLQAELAKPDLSAEARAKLIAELKTVNLQYEQMSHIMNGLKKDGVSLRDLEAYQKALTKEIKNSTLSVEQLEAKYKELNEVTAIINEHKAKLKGTNQTIAEQQEGLRGISGAFTQLSGAAQAYIGNLAANMTMDAVNMVTSQLMNVKEKVVDYQQSLSELSAVTGVSGEGLTDLEGRAESLTTIITEGGQQITNSSTDILKAFQLVGSAKPELLKNAEGMQAITKEAIILSKASKQTLPEAIENLTTIMEQFNAPADQAGRYINAMAAGAKEGSVEIKETSNAVQKFGAVSKSMNVSVEESIALVQTMGKTFKSGEETGTALRNVLSKIQAPENLSKEALEGLNRYNVNLNVLKDTTLPVSVRLKELSKIQGDAALMGKVFGDENLVAGRVILSNIPKFEGLTKAVSNTNEAYTQAGIMADNLGNDIKVMQDEIDGAATGLGKALSPALRSVTQGFTEGVKWAREHWGTIVIWTKAIVTAGAVVGSYYATVKWLPALKELWAKRQVVLTAATAAYETLLGVLSGRITVATIAQRLMNIAMSLNPIGLVVAGITALIGAYAMYSSQVTQAVKNQQMLNDINATAMKNIAGEKVQLEQLLKIAKDEKASKEDRLKAIKKLNEISPEYLSGLTLENIKTQEGTDLVNKYVAAIEKKAKAEAALQKRTELEKEMIDLKANQTDTGPGVMQQTWNIIKAGGNVAQSAMNNAVSSAENYKEKVGEVESKIKSLNDYIGKNQIDITGTSTPTTPNAPKNTVIAKGDDKAKESLEKLKRFQEELKNFENDMVQRTAEAEQAEELKIKEKYQKQLDALEDFKKAYPAKKSEANALESAFTQQMNMELIALNISRINKIQSDVDKHQQEAYEKTLTAEDREKAHIVDKYAKDIAYLKEVEADKIKVSEDAKKKAHAQLIALEAAQQTEMEAIDAKKQAKDKENAEKNAQEKIDIQDKINKALADTTISTLDRELSQLDLQYKALLELAKKQGIHVTALEEAIAKKRKDIIYKSEKDSLEKTIETNQKKLQAYSQLYKELGNVFAAAGELFAKEGEKNTAFQKAMTLAQIAFDTASGISSAIAAGMKVGITPIEKAIVIAGGIALVLTNIARAKKVLTEAPVVKQKYEGGYSDDVIGATDGKRYKVNYVGRPKTGMLPDSPTVYPSASGYPILASEKGREYLVANEDLSVPAIFRHVEAIENLKRNGTTSVTHTQMKEGGYTSEVGNKSNDTIDSNNYLLSIEIKRLNDNIENGILAVVNDDTITALFRRYDKLNKASGLSTYP